MAANPELVKQMGVSDENVRRINVIHDELDACLNEIDEYLTEIDRVRLLKHISDLEFSLQRLWGFTEDRRYHTWRERMRKRLREVDYLGRTWRCTITDEERTVRSADLDSGKLFGVGKGFVDFGDGYTRVVGPLVVVK